MLRKLEFTGCLNSRNPVNPFQKHPAKTFCQSRLETHVNHFRKKIKIDSIWIPSQSKKL